MRASPFHVRYNNKYSECENENNWVRRVEQWQLVCALFLSTDFTGARAITSRRDNVPARVLVVSGGQKREGFNGEIFCSQSKQRGECASLHAGILQ